MIPLQQTGNGSIVDVRLRTQLITLAIGPCRDEGDADPVRPLLGAVDGVEAVEWDAASGRAWVFADGRVEVQLLVDLLVRWGYAVHLVQDRMEWPA